MDIQGANLNSRETTLPPLALAMTEYENVLKEHYTTIVHDVASFVENVEVNPNTRELPSGLIVAAPNVTNQSSLTDAITQQIRTNEDIVVVSLLSTQLPNLKTALKYVNQQATSQFDGNSDTNWTQRGQYLNYDLQMLHDCIQTQKIRKVVLYLRDSEGFEESLLSDLIDTFSSWMDRIPVVLIFGIATSIDLFQERLSQATLSLLQATPFEINQLDVDILFKTIMTPVRPPGLWLGPSLSRSILQRHAEFVQTTNDFARSMKYLYMTHFFSNPLSILTMTSDDVDTLESFLQHEHFEAIRTLPSFRSYAKKLMDAGDIDSVRSLLDDDRALFDAVRTNLKLSKNSLHEVMASIEVLRTVQSTISLKKNATWSELYILAMSGELDDSSLVREVLLSVKKMPSDSMHGLITQLSHRLPAFNKISEDLAKLMAATKGDSAPLRSEHDIHHNTLRTTVVAQKVELSKQTAALSKQDMEYSKIVSRVDTVLREYFQQSFINPQDLFLHEILIYDAKSPYRDAFTPRPRFAVERALSSPHDYLGCTCCNSDQGGLSSTQPTAAILYQLYLESGSQINVSDLWSAFSTIVATEDPEDEEAEQQRNLCVHGNINDSPSTNVTASALFSQALAELKYMGMVKGSRKKTDHLTKLAWKGL
ncbi:MAG: hypothetical protein Q9195_001123 [Heterodermia aff. obscurata]